MVLLANHIPAVIYNPWNFHILVLLAQFLSDNPVPLRCLQMIRAPN